MHFSHKPALRILGLLLVFVASAGAQEVTLEFDQTNVGRATGFSNNAGVAGINGMRWGILVDTAGDGFDSVAYDGGFDIDTSGFLTFNNGTPTDDYYVAHPDQATTLNLPATGTDPGGDGGITVIPNVPFGGATNITENDAFAIIWFQTGTDNNDKFGLLENTSETGKFIIPASGTTVSYAAFFALSNPSADPPQAASLTFGVPATEIAVELTATSTNLTDGVTTANFGAVAKGGTTTLQFTIKNVGQLDLTGLLDGPSITIDGSHAGLFTVTVPPGSGTLTPNTSTTFTVQFAPLTHGTKNATLHIPSNDGNENPFDIPLTGSGIATPGTIALGSAWITVNETDGTVNIPIVRTGGTDGDIDVTFTASNGTALAGAANDYHSVPTFANLDDGETNVDVPIALVSPGTSEANETFTVAISNPTGGTLGTPSTATVLIIDSQAGTFAGDSIAPTVTLTSPANGSVHPVDNGGTLPLTGTAKDNKGVRKVQYSLNGGAFTDADLTKPGAPSTVYNAALTPLLTGTNTVRVRSVDFATAAGNATVRSSSVGTATVTVASAPVGLAVNSDFLGQKVVSVSGTTVTLSGPPNVTIGFVSVTASSTGSPTVTVDSVPPGLANGSTLLGRTVTNVNVNTVTLSGNANATISNGKFVTYTPVVSVTAAATNSNSVTVASVPSILGIGSTLLGRTVTGIAVNTITLSGNATLAGAGQRPFTPAVVTPFVTEDRVSATVTSTFTVTRPLLVEINSIDGGAGTTSFPPQSYKEVGKSYTIIATPTMPPTPTVANPGSIFVGWSVTNTINPGLTQAEVLAQIGVALTSLQKQSLTFIFREGLKLTATFAKNPYPALAGTYNGLIRPSILKPDRPPLGPGGDDFTVSTNATEGRFTANVTAGGAFSGTLTIDGLDLPVSGAFDSAGDARFGTARLFTKTITRLNKPSLVLSLEIDLVTPGADDNITGELSAKGFQQSVITDVSEVRGDRAFYNASNTLHIDYLGPASANGIFNVIFPAKDESEQVDGYSKEDFPQGSGWGTITLSKTGIVTITGTLADGSPINGSTALSQANTFPLFVQLYKKLGFISGMVALDKDAPESDLAGPDPLKWLRPSQFTQHYPDGWSVPIDVDLLGAKYVVTGGESVLKAANGGLIQDEDEDGNTTLTFKEGSLSEPLGIVKTANLSDSDVATNVPINDPTFTLKVNRTTGAVTGVFTHTDDTQPSYSAVVFQKGPNAGAYGFFLTKQPAVIDYTGESGAVILIGEPAGP